jgi:hypothetical protein
MKGIAVTHSAVNAIEPSEESSDGAECRRLREAPAFGGADLTTVQTRKSAAVAAALLHLAQRTHARLAVLSINGLGHLGASDGCLRGAFPLADPISGPGEWFRLGSPGALARRTGGVATWPRSLASLDEPGVQAVLDFIGVMPGHPLLEPIRARYATGYSGELGEVALLAVLEAAVTPKWVVTLTWTSGCPAWQGSLEGFFRTLSESTDLVPSAIDLGAGRVPMLDTADIQHRRPPLLR